MFRLLKKLLRRLTGEIDLTEPTVFPDDPDDIIYSGNTAHHHSGHDDKKRFGYSRTKASETEDRYVDDYIDRTGWDNEEEYRIRTAPDDYLMDDYDDSDEVDPEQAAIWDDPFDGRAVEVPIEPFIDLHTFAPDETEDVLEAYIEAAREKGYKRVRIIHGKGVGVQRQIVQSYLKRHYAVKRFHTARPIEGGQGATIAYLE
jgi:hypothetical protein